MFGLFFVFCFVVASGFLKLCLCSELSSMYMEKDPSVLSSNMPLSMIVCPNLTFLPATYRPVKGCIFYNCKLIDINKSSESLSLCLHFFFFLASS